MIIIGGRESEQEIRERLYLGGIRPPMEPNGFTRKEHLAAIKSLVALAKVNNIPMNGCGPEGWHRHIVKALNKPWWLLWLCSFAPFCRRHDIRYWVGGDENERYRADQEFLKGLESEVAFKFARIWSWGVHYGDQTAHDFYEAVHLFGKGAWKYWDAPDQPRNCDTCVHSLRDLHQEPCQSCLFDAQGNQRPQLERLMKWKGRI